jgi:hypothetical protein
LKIYDLHADPSMSPNIGLLHAMVVYNFQRLKRLVEGMTQDEIDYKGPHGELNSIAQLLRHLAVVDLHWVYRLQSASVPSELLEAFGPMNDEDGKIPLIKNVSLQTLLDEYMQIQEMFRGVCLKKTDDDLDEVVPFENGNRATVRW